MRKKILLSILLTCSITCLSTAQTGQQKSVTLKTFFPEPVGSYARIRLLRRDALPDTCSPGELASFSTTDYIGATRLTVNACYRKDNDWNGIWRPFDSVWRQTIINNTEILWLPRGMIETRTRGISIGTTDQAVSPLTLENDGGILALDDWSNAPARPWRHPQDGFFLLWDPERAAFRALSRTDHQANIAVEPIALYSTAFGRINLVRQQASMIYGGELNTIDHRFSIIGSGSDNIIGAQGDSDTLSANAIIGGEWNKILGTSATHSFIGGGNNNTNRATHSSIAGGDHNTIESSADFSAIGGGGENISHASFGAIIGGQYNKILNNANYSFIGGGFNNSISSPHSLIAGGEKNTILATGEKNAIIGGFQNQTETINNYIIGGYKNHISAAYSIIGGGESNYIESNQYNAIFGGKNNIINSNPLGPPNIKNSADRGAEYCLIGGGENNRISVFAGTSETNRYPTAIIGGGKDNIVEAKFSFIGGGKNNSIPRNAVIHETIIQANYVATIPGGEGNINHAQHSWVGGRNMVNKEVQSKGFHFLWGHTDSPITPPSWDTKSVFALFQNVNVGIQTTTPKEKLDVNGHTHASGQLFLTKLPWVTGTANKLNIGTADHKFYMDLAETFDADREVSAGTVLTISPDPNEIRLTPSSSAYDPHVIGIVSTSPAVVLKGHETIMMPDPAEFAVPTNTPPVALKGRVPVKVTLENGPIQPGDALTTSSLAGHAMKSTDWDRSWGTTIGKAMEPFTGGPNGETEGMIMAFVAIY